MATLGWKLNGGKEIIPFAHWSLFSIVPNLVNQPSIRFFKEDTEIKESQLRKPRLLKEWFNSLMTASPKTIELQNLLERDVVKPSAIYELAYEEYKPRPKWDLDENLIDLSLGVYKNLELVWAECTFFHPDIHDINTLKEYPPLKEKPANIQYCEGSNYTIVIGHLISENILSENNGNRLVYAMIGDSLISKSPLGYPVKITSSLKNKASIQPYGFYLLLPFIAEKMAHVRLIISDGDQSFYLTGIKK